jgi:ribonuclease VapC
MMVDTSVVVAILRNEIEAQDYARLINRVGRAYMVAPSYVELSMVMIGNKTPQSLNKIKTTLGQLSIRVVSFTPEMADHAARAFERYGKGRGHPAQLNFGDCISYAASKVEAMPLLFKGNDFRLTDVECAI